MTTSQLNAQRPRGFAIFTILLGGLGLLASFQLLTEYLKTLSSPGYTPNCNISVLVTCGPNMGSWQGSVFGFSNPILGIAAFVVPILIGFALLAGARFASWFWALYLCGLFGGFIFISWLAYQSIFNLGTLCPWCMVVWLAMIPLLLGILIGALAISSVSTALPSIRGDLTLSDTGALWLVDVYSLALAATLILASRIGDAFGRKRIVLLGLAGFAVLNLVGGLAQDGLVLIVVRALLGVAEAFVVAGVVATIGAHYQARQRVLAYGLWTATFGTGSALGPVLGGLIVDAPGMGWRWVFFISVPFALISFALLQRFLRIDHVPVKVRFDYAGAVLIATSLGLLLTWITFVGELYAWRSWPSAALLAPGLALLAATVLVERRAENPLVPLAIIRELEGVDRGRYAGPVGWIDGEGGGEWVIALRGADIALDGSIRAFAGAGIVAGSDPDEELAETAVKLRPITDALADPLP